MGEINKQEFKEIVETGYIQKSPYKICKCPKCKSYFEQMIDDNSLCFKCREL